MSTTMLHIAVESRIMAVTSSVGAGISVGPNTKARLDEFILLMALKREVLARLLVPSAKW